MHVDNRMKKDCFRKATLLLFSYIWIRIKSLVAFRYDKLQFFKNFLGRGPFSLKCCFPNAAWLFSVEGNQVLFVKAVAMQTLCYDCHPGEIQPKLKSMQSDCFIHVLLHTRNVTFENFMCVPMYSSKTYCPWEQCLEKSTANSVFGNIFSSFHISFLPLNHSEVRQYSINRKYRLHNRLAILRNILSISLFKNNRKKKNSLWPHFLHPKWQVCWPMPDNLPKFFLSSIAKEVFILFQKSTSRASGCKVSCTG